MGVRAGKKSTVEKNLAESGERKRERGCGIIAEERRRGREGGYEREAPTRSQRVRVVPGRHHHPGDGHS
jgi:hypothetical protein